MAYIKKLRDNELIGGTDNTDVYPITTTQAVFSQGAEGSVPEGVEHKLEDRLQHHEADIEELKQKRMAILVPADELPEASADSMNKIYLIPTEDYEDTGIREEWMTVETAEGYSWEKIGSTAIDLRNYYTSQETDAVVEEALDGLLDNYYTKNETDDKIPYVTLKELPDAYLKRVHYDISQTKESRVKDYVNDTQREERLDQPKPIVIDTNGNVALYASTVTKAQHIYTAVQGKVNMYNLIPGERYFCHTVNTDVWRSFTLARGRRFIFAGNIMNVRDLGGIVTEDGGHIAYGKIYRGSELRGAVIRPSSSSIKYISDLGITLDLDLRSQSELNGYTGTPIAGASYARYSFIRFEDIEDMTEDKKTRVREVFNLLANTVINGGSVYMHCAWGYHRAGFLSTLVEGVLGVKQCEIDKDYELSAFSPLGDVTRNDSNYTTGINVINNQYGGSWSRFLSYCGVKKTLIDKFKTAMIADINKQDDLSPQYYEYTHTDLVELRNQGLLVPGAKYRMIDYETEGAYEAYVAACSGIEDLPSYTVAGHQFDLLLTAISPTAFDCNVKAVHSVRDTEGYFADTDLSKWEIKYELENRKDKYSWAVDEYIKTGEEIIVYPYSTGVSGVDVYYYIIEQNDATLRIKHDLSNYSFGVVTEVTGDLAEIFSVDDDVRVTHISQTYNITNLSFGSRITTTNLINCIIKDVNWHVEGKGVIYYMKDERGNEFPFDFKNILFKHDNQWVYSLPNADARNVVVKPWIDEGIQNLNRNLFVVKQEGELVYGIEFAQNTHDNIIAGEAINCTIGAYSSYNILSNIENCKMGDDCMNIENVNMSGASGTPSMNNIQIGTGCYNLKLVGAHFSQHYAYVDDYTHDQTILYRNKRVVNTNITENSTRNLMEESRFNQIMK